MSFLFAQFHEELEPDKSSKSHALAFGMHLHSYGFGFDYQQFKAINEKLNRAVFVEFSSLKIESIYNSQGGKNYIFDKKNYCYNLSFLFALERSIWSKNTFSNVNFKLGIGLGPTFALLKPYYIEVAKAISGQQAVVEVVPYDGGKYSYNDIVGEGDFFRGIDKMSFVSGLKIKLFGNLDFAGNSLYVRALHVGLQADIYPKKVPIFDLNPNKQYYIGGFLGFMIGNAW